MRPGDGEERLRAWQAYGAAGQELRERRPVDPDRRGEGRVIQTRTVEEAAQPLAKDTGEIALVHRRPAFRTLIHLK